MFVEERLFFDGRWLLVFPMVVGSVVVLLFA
jgi:hypothetical protein